jgi:sugar phosphate isomerase/epimerase
MDRLPTRPGEKIKMESLSRRRILKTVAALGIAGPMVAKEPSAHNPDLRFPTNPRERLAVTSWPFRAFIESPTNGGREKSKPGMDLKEFAAMVVKRFGVHNINPLGDHFSSTDAAYVTALRKAVEDAGSHVVDLGLGGKRFGDPDASQRAAAIEYGRKWIDIAVSLGCPSVRQHLRATAGQPPDVDRSAESLAKLAEYGSSRNVIVNLENDSPGSEDPFFIIRVLQRVNSPYLRALPDFGNSLRGHDQQYNERAVDAMFKYAYSMCHVKDRLTSKDGKVDQVNLARMFEIAKSNRYRGYFSMEVDTASSDPFEGTKYLLEQSDKYLS